MQSHGCGHDGLANSRVHELSCVRCPCQMMGGLHVRIALFLFGCCASVGDLFEMVCIRLHNVVYGCGRELVVLSFLLCPTMAVSFYMFCCWCIL